jgi:hypothetical protein
MTASEEEQQRCHVHRLALRRRLRKWAIAHAVDRERETIWKEGGTVFAAR